MDRRQKRRLVRNGKMLAVCGAMAYMAVGAAVACENIQNGNVGYRQEAYTYQTEVLKEEAILKLTVEVESLAIEEICQSKVHSYDWSGEEAYLLAKIAMAEAEGEDTNGKALVILVVLNRVRSSGFPDSIETVIFQNDQFSPIENGRWDAIEPNQDCLDALEMVENGWDESFGAMYFESESSSQWHRDNLHFLFQYGKHYFYREKELAE